VGYYKLTINEQTVFDVDPTLSTTGLPYGNNLYWLDGVSTTYTLSVTICPSSVTGASSTGTTLHANIEASGWQTEQTHADTSFANDDVKTFTFTGIADDTFPTNVKLRASTTGNIDAVCIYKLQLNENILFNSGGSTPTAYGNN